MKKIGLILLLAGFLLPLASAAQKMEYVDSLGRHYVLRPVGRGLPYAPQHEFRIGIGAYAFLSDLRGGGCYDDAVWGSSSSLGERMKRFKQYTGPEYTTGTLTVMYSYRVARMLELGAAFSFTQFYSRQFSTFDNAVLHRRRDTYYSVMPQLRFSWLNRPTVRMYSALSLGLEWERSREFNGYTITYMGFTGQFTWLGISVGKRVFGFAEFGWGGRGVFSAGVGYRFEGAKK